MARFHKHDVARFQLQTAVEIFLRGLDRSSVITLAGIASGIFDTLERYRSDIQGMDKAQS
jgi:hypothetical protein